MKPTTAEWDTKAEGDRAVMERECQVTVCPNYDAVCFQAQQCAEKYLKARLCEADVVFGKTHDLPALLDHVLDLEPGWERFREDLAYLSDFAVSFRYPGESADRDSALDAQNRCRAFRRAARQSFGLPA
jgi:HEPN domain-containing protein